ncbi:hypothetical protein QTL95_20705 [Rhizobium sp. S152]|uniref:hypothetical protein n=1 Tax=Rhizobium sp. S152 TaxID=3055038 RepID=UPI0025A9D85B|nr:hypothetical protein [Rhizobium sp. S152]MDM9628319.1 hypothetical protein [Rhizobium sp. S152]
MSLLKSILRWRDERHLLAQLQFGLEEIDAKFIERVKKEKLQRGSDAWRDAYFDYDSHRQLWEADIDQLQTQRYVRRAKAWEVPIPPHPVPAPDSPVCDDEFWSWSQPHGRYYLTYKAQAVLRRDIYAEIEMRYKPWLAWMAITFSALSLIIALIRL